MSKFRVIKDMSEPITEKFKNLFVEDFNQDFTFGNESRGMGHTPKKKPKEVSPRPTTNEPENELNFPLVRYFKSTENEDCLIPVVIDIEKKEPEIINVISDLNDAVFNSALDEAIIEVIRLNGIKGNLILLNDFQLTYDSSNCNVNAIYASSHEMKIKYHFTIGLHKEESHNEPDLKGKKTSSSSVSSEECSDHTDETSVLSTPTPRRVIFDQIEADAVKQSGLQILRSASPLRTPKIPVSPSIPEIKSMVHRSVSEVTTPIKSPTKLYPNVDNVLSTPIMLTDKDRQLKRNYSSTSIISEPLTSSLSPKKRRFIIERFQRENPGTPMPPSLIVKRRLLLGRPSVIELV
ncbi:hypothetical protein HK096_010097 [Nowakowskiella sp. JEL0078]|nr:hypothetical protein HK096_010097 [Nowakowskiella sp. JEL0078]